jgi:hypothetical protein
MVLLTVEPITASGKNSFRNKNCRVLNVVGATASDK